MELVERVELYNKAFPKYPKLFYDKGWLIGCWNIGACYKSENGYYGEFPRGYLARLMSLFPDKQNILHIFSGSLKPGNYTRVDSNPLVNPDIVANAEELSKSVKPGFDLIISDPPYQPADSAIYKCKHPNKRLVMSECAKLVTSGAHLCWLDERLPMYRKTEWRRVGEIMLTRSTNHRIRATFIFERV